MLLKGQLFNFQDSIQSSDFENNYIKTQSLTLPEKVAGNHMCHQFYNISSVTDTLVLP